MGVIGAVRCVGRGAGGSRAAPTRCGTIDGKKVLNADPKSVLCQM